MKLMTNHTVFFIFFLLVSHLAYAQSEKVAPLDNQAYKFKKLYLHTDRENYFEKDTIWFKAYYLIGQTHQLAAGTYTMYTQLFDDRGEMINKAIWPISNGISEGHLPIPDSLAQGNYTLQAYTELQMQYGEEAYFHKILKISRVYSDQTQSAHLSNNNKIDVSFMPEGGELLSNHNNTVGFAAVNAQGLPAEVNVKILDDSGNIATACKTTYQGLGKFLFSPEPDKSYSAYIDEDSDFRYDFENIMAHGIKLEYERTLNDEVHFKIVSNTKMHLGSTFYFTIMNKGHIVFDQKFDFLQKQMMIKVKKEALPPGVNRLILLNKEFQPVSERMYFSGIDELNKVEIQLDKNSYLTRSQVNLELSDELMATGTEHSLLSVAVVDKIALENSDPLHNIQSWLLIDSELKGHIYNPSAYFRDDERLNSSAKLDLLMLTHGWAKYFWNDIVDTEKKNEINEAEGITLNGKLERYFGKKGRGKAEVEIRIFNNSIFIDDKIKTDAEGLFTIKDMVIVDTAYLYMQARNSKGKSVGEIRIDSLFKENAEISNSFLPYQNIADISTDLRSKQYYNERAIRDYQITSEAVLLDEIVVEGKKIEEDDGHFRIYNKPSNSLKLTYADYAYPNVTDFLPGRVAGVTVNDNQIVIRGMGSFTYTPPLFMVDGFPVDQEVANSIPMAQIDVIEVLRGPEAAIFGTRATNGVISIFTKKGGPVEYREYYTPGRLAMQIKGYEPYREFYTPKYTTETISAERPDHRITLYWNPEIITVDGKASMSFYTSDDIGEYRIFVEGITESGMPCLGTAEFIVDNTQSDIE